VVEVVSTVVAGEKAKPLATAKKAEAATAAEELMRDRGWLPEPLANIEVAEVMTFGDDDDDNEAGDESSED
jgi:hypothetical protein